MPRPEFDLPNNPNPLLLDFREHHGDAELWLDDLTVAPVPWEFLQETANAWKIRVTQEHIDHARKVLTRLAAHRALVK